MGFAIDGERWTQTLSAVLATPANRAALFLGRAGPVLVNAAVTAATGFIGGALLLGFRMPWSSVPAIAFLLLLASFASTGLGMLTGAVGLRMRDVPIIANLSMAVLLIFCGVNVPLDKLPDWMHTVALALPLTHAIEAARQVAEGASLASVRSEVATEFVLGAGYLLAGFGLLRWFEYEGRRRGTLDRA
jgi:ABC-2 type transport system permease protein